MTTNEVSKLLGVNETCVRKYKETFRYHKSYYWGINSTADKLVALVKEKIPTAVIVDCGNHYHSFVGSAESGSAKDSFYWVTFKI